MKRQIILGPDDKLLHLGQRPPRVVTWLLVEQIGFFLAYAFADGPKWIAALLAASAESTLARLQLHQPLTALWIHLSTRDLIFNALLLWLVGSALERWWGGRRFLLFWCVTGMVGLGLGTVAGLMAPTVQLSGSAGSAVAMLVATAMIFPRHHLFIYKGVLPIRARGAMLGMAALLAVGDLLAGAYLMVVVQAGGAATALLFLLKKVRPGKKVDRRGLEVLDGGKPRGFSKKKKEPKLWN